MSHLEVADIFRAQGSQWRASHAGQINRLQYKVMNAIEQCRSAALGGHVWHCPACGEDQIAYNSCRNRHCPKCQASAAKRWLEARQQELLPVDYYHLVFTLPAPLSELAYHNKAVVYAILFRAAAHTLLTIGGDPRHLGAKLGITLVLHTWGSNLSHHPHVHGIVPGGGLSTESDHWIPCRKGFFLSVRVLSRLFRRLFLEQLRLAYDRGQIECFGELQDLKHEQAFRDWLRTLRQVEWVVYSKQPFAGPEAVLAYLSRYSHRVAIANSRLIAFDDRGVTFKWKDYRCKGKTRHKVMTLATDEFIRRFLMHVLPAGFHRIRHYGLFANSGKQAYLDQVKALLNKAVESNDAESVSRVEPETVHVIEASEIYTGHVCPHCNQPMIVVQVFGRGQLPRAPPKTEMICQSR